ncbi:hypothetical protein AB3X91_37885 [Paraburkholderia sp. BR14263]|uniref:hypothetical protein n=1 Tax=unclassified Paraburkholderia TaxID=2615204 RepID=UPI0034CFC0E0
MDNTPQRKRLFVGGHLHGHELPVGTATVTAIRYHSPEDFPTDPMRTDEYRTLKLTLKTPTGTKRQRFRVLRGIKRSRALRMTRSDPDRFWNTQSDK